MTRARDIADQQDNLGGAVAPYVAGKNAVINGGMDIFQRSTSSSTLGNYTTADRWYVGAWSGTGTYSRDATLVPSGSLYSLKFTASATAQPYMIQAIETLNAISLANQTVTLSAQVASSASSNIDLILQYATTTDESVAGTYTTATLVSASSTVATSTTFAKKSVTYTLPSTAKTLRIIVQSTSTIASAATVNLGQVQLELGALATPFARAGGTIQGELAACQRYYYRWIPSGTYAYASNGLATAAGTANFIVNTPATLRTAPTAVEYSGLRVTDRVSVFSSVSSITIFASTEAGIIPAINVNTSGLTAYRPVWLGANGSTSDYVGFSAEL